MQHAIRHLQRLQRGVHHKPPWITNSGRSFWYYEDPPTHSLLTQSTRPSSQKAANPLAWEHKKGFPVWLQTWEAGTECAFTSSTGVISFFPTLVSKVLQHTGRRNKSPMICKIQDIYKKDRIKYLMLSIWYSPRPATCEWIWLLEQFAYNKRNDRQKCQSGSSIHGEVPRLRGPVTTGEK